MKDVYVVIPTLNPNIDLLNKLIKDLKKVFTNIIIVNDGSKGKYDKYFESLENDSIIVLKHYRNYGKGRALKTALNYLLNNYQSGTIVTADSDGQHQINDIINCVNEAKKNPNSLVLGCRTFGDNVPFKSKFGNIITSKVFKLFVGLNISDTQTGLRAFSFKVAENFLSTLGERYEYETRVLIDCKEKDITIKEVPIKTIYIDNNSESHFRPFQDSLCIYKLFFKYIISSISSFLIDIFLFTLFLKAIPFTEKIFIATILARIISSYYNYLINSKLVFKKMNKASIIKYFILVVIQMCVSGLFVSLLAKSLVINTTLIKVMVDTIIFLVNFIIQREWVFKNN